MWPEVQGCYHRVNVEIDSQCALSLIGGYLLSSYLAVPLVERVNGLLRNDWDLQLSHVFREKN